MRTRHRNTCRYFLYDSEHTKWDKLSIQGPITLGWLKQKLESDYNIEIMIISYETHSLYTSFNKGHEARLKNDIKQVIGQITKQTLPKDKLTVNLGIAACQSGTDIDIILPDVRYYLWYCSVD